jgi:DNA-binding MarR family transcriptional regulator
MGLGADMNPQDLPLGLRFLATHYLLTQALTARITDRLERQHGIEVRDLIALSYIVWGGANTPSDLARELQLPKYVISRSLDRLVQLGAVVRNVDLLDARRTRVQATEAGKDFHLKAISDVQESTQPVLERFGDAEPLLAALERLAGLLNDTNGGREK